MLIDTHCHLADDQYLKDEVTQIIKKCQEEEIILWSMSTNFRDFEVNLEYSSYNNVMIGFGVHPYEAENVIKIPSWQEKVQHILNNPKVKFIGEVGLDFYKKENTKKQQIEVFEFFVSQSIDSSLTLSIHTRNAEKEVIKILSKYQKIKPIKAIFHCFTSTDKQIVNTIIENHWYFGFGGVITFKKSDELRKIFRYIFENKGNILLETDSPYISPEPYRGKKNYPYYVKIIYDYIKTFIPDFEINTKNIIYLLS